MVVISLFDGMNFDEIHAIVKNNWKRFDELGEMVKANLAEAKDLSKLAEMAIQRGDINGFERVEKIHKDRLAEARRYSDESQTLLERNRILVAQMDAMVR